jgi:hypothetical protein
MEMLVNSQLRKITKEELIKKSNENIEKLGIFLSDLILTECS